MSNLVITPPGAAPQQVVMSVANLTLEAYVASQVLPALITTGPDDIPPDELCAMAFNFAESFVAEAKERRNG